MDYKDLLKRYLMLIPGVFILAFGIAFVTKAGLGASPISSIPFTLSMIIPRITMGTYLAAINIMLVLAQVVILWNKSGEAVGRPAGRAITIGDIAGQFIISVVMGYMTDFSLFLLKWFEPTTYPLMIIFAFVGSAIMAVGISIQLEANVSMAPGDAFVKALTVVTKLPFNRAKLICDWSMVGISAILCLVFLHNLAGVREGTVICALTTGNVIRIFRRIAFKK